MSARSLAANSTVMLQSYLDRLLAEIPEAQSEPASSPVQNDAASHSARRDTGTPDASICATWREQTFQAMLFHVSEMRFAAPLIHLQGVVPFAETPTRLPETPDWFLGVCTYRGQNVRVVDTAGLTTRGQILDVKRDYQHVILLQAGSWGLACDAVSEVLTIAPSTVQWRKRLSDKPWLAGTLRERLCAVLDMDALALSLEREAVGTASSAFAQCDQDTRDESGVVGANRA